MNIYTGIDVFFVYAALNRTSGIKKTIFVILGTLGLLCEINIDDCVPGACHNNGTCSDRVGGFECKCPAGFVGPRCEGDINECLSNPCSFIGTQDCVQLVNDYQCNCKPGKIFLIEI